MIDKCRKIIISKLNGKYVLMNIAGNKAIDCYAYSELVSNIGIGSILNARVTKNIKNVAGSFINAAGENGFINKSIKCETVLPVMYKKEGIKDKKPLFTDDISISGRYCVVFDAAPSVRCSSKLSKHVQQKLKEDYIDIAKQYSVGLLLRTQCADVDIELVSKEIELISKTINYIREQAANRPDNAIFYRPLPDIVRDCLELIRFGVDEIVTDDDEVVTVLSSEYEAYFGMSSVSELVPIRKYEDDMLPLYKLYAFEGKLSEILNRQVHMHNGLNITFDPTEALCAIDINSASFTKGNTKEEAFLSVNKQAAIEVFRQIRLRNISGIIIVDFINMNQDESYKELEELIRSLCANDVVKCEFHDFTKLGLAEISRQKVKAGFKSQYLN